MSPYEDMVAMATMKSYSRMVLAQGFLTDG